MTGDGMDWNFYVYQDNYFCKQDWEFNLEYTDEGCAGDIDRIEFTVKGPDGFHVSNTEFAPPYFAFGDDYNTVKGYDMEVGKWEWYFDVYSMGEDGPFLYRSMMWPFEIVDCECVVPNRPQ